MPTFLSLDDGMEMLNADHIDRFRIGRLSSTTPDERGHSIGYSLIGQTGITTLDGGLTLDEATAALAALAKSVAKASETHAIVDPLRIIDTHRRTPDPAAAPPG